MSQASFPLSAISLPSDCGAAAAALNRGCICQSVDHQVLRCAMEGEAPGDVPLGLLDVHRHLFSDTRVFVAETHLEKMGRLVAAIERIVALAGWQERVLARSPKIARYESRTRGVFLGYDFHLADDGPKLIEINTNAGGAMLNAMLLRAQRACCEWSEGEWLGVGSIEAEFVQMFRDEWSAARGDGTPGYIVIVDDEPEKQFLAPEFELFRRLFEAHGIAAAIVAPQALNFDGRCLSHNGRSVDLVYNRLTDFSLEAPEHLALRQAYLADAVVLTPHPRAHALYADKRNLVLLADDGWLQTIGVGADDRELLRECIPCTVEVRGDNVSTFWSERKRWFFKPVAGYGSKGAYRGDKLTRRVFDEIVGGDYVAQALVAPSERRLRVDGTERNLKLDLRNYAYGGRVQLVSARLYHGQTTNFRTPGGGFAAVFPVRCEDAAASE